MRCQRCGNSLKVIPFKKHIVWRVVDDGGSLDYLNSKHEAEVSHGHYPKGHQFYKHLVIKKCLVKKDSRGDHWAILRDVNNDPFKKFHKEVKYKIKLENFGFLAIRKNKLSVAGYGMSKEIGDKLIKVKVTEI